MRSLSCSRFLIAEKVTGAAVEKVVDPLDPTRVALLDRENQVKAGEGDRLAQQPLCRCTLDEGLIGRDVDVGAVGTTLLLEEDLPLQFAAGAVFEADGNPQFLLEARSRLGDGEPQPGGAVDDQGIPGGPAPAVIEAN